MSVALAILLIAIAALGAGTAAWAIRAGCTPRQAFGFDGPWPVWMFASLALVGAFLLGVWHGTA